MRGEYEDNCEKLVIFREEKVTNQCYMLTPRRTWTIWHSDRVHLTHFSCSKRRAYCLFLAMRGKKNSINERIMIIHTFCNIAYLTSQRLIVLFTNVIFIFHLGMKRFSIEEMWKFWKEKLHKRPLFTQKNNIDTKSS